MIRTIACFAVSLAFAGFAVAQTMPQTAEGSTAARHTQKGVSCVMCHPDPKDFSVAPRQKQCLACHGTYEKLAERTKNVNPNPHYNHFGDRDCNTCHKGHVKSVVSCDQCHKFDLKTP